MDLLSGPAAGSQDLTNDLLTILEASGRCGDIGSFEAGPAGHQPHI